VSFEFITPAFAQAAVPGGSDLMTFLPMIAIFVVFYFLLIRPQQKKAREHQQMLANLKRGDQIVTSGGMLGKITGITDRMVTIEVAEKIRLRVLRSHIPRFADVVFQVVQFDL